MVQAFAEKPKKVGGRIQKAASALKSEQLSRTHKLSLPRGKGTDPSVQITMS